MMRSLFAGVSSLKAHQTRMDVIGNNIANVNTVGFKSSRVTFSDMLSQTSSGASAPGTNLGGINPKQIGLGASVESVDLVFTDGSPQNSGKNTDIALSGNGLFVLKNGDSYYYSRDGAFEFDTNGSYVMPGSGLYVQGWNASDGVLNTNGATENIVVKSGQTMPGTATTAVNYASNLNAAEPTITNITYTAGSTNSNPSSVINYKQVTRYAVTGAQSFTYDPRVMTLNGNMEETYVDTITYTDSTGDEITTTVATGSETRAITDAGTYTVGSTRTGTADPATMEVTLTDGTTQTVDITRTYTVSALPTYTVTKTVVPTADDMAGTATNTTYSLTLDDGSQIDVDSLDGYTVNTAYDATRNITSLNTTETSTVSSMVLTLSDDTTVEIASEDLSEYGYTIGGTYPEGAGTTIKSVAFTTSVTTTTNGTAADPVTTTRTYPDGNSSTNDDSFTITGTDNTDTNIVLTYNDGSTATAVAGTSYTVGEDDAGSVLSINVDGTNVIAATLTLSDGSTQKVTSGFYQINHGVPVTTVVTIYDSEGQDHAVSLLIDKNNNSVDNDVNNDALALARVLDDDGNTITGAKIVKANKDAGGNIISYDYTYDSGTETNIPATAYADHVVWDNRWSVFMAPGEGQTGPVYSYEKTEEDSTKTTGYLNYTEDDAGNVFGKPAYIYFNDDGSYSSAATANASLYLVYSNGNGAAPTTANVDFSNVTQYAGSTTAYGSTDGNAYGILQSVSIDASGIITGTYSNGILRTEAQIAVAQFVNSAGLTKTGTSLYQQSNNSGEANIKTLDAFGLSITPSALEMSNVELASELADMIVTQRGFQSNSKIITVADEMLETIINMKR